MPLAEIVSLIFGGSVVIGLVVGAASWFFKRGGTEREMTLAVKDNTKSNRELSSALHELKAFVIDRLHDHDVRLTKHDGRLDRVDVRLDQIEANDSRSPNRNAGSQG